MTAFLTRIWIRFKHGITAKAQVIYHRGRRAIPITLLVSLRAGLMMAEEPVPSLVERLPPGLRPPFHWQSSEPLLQAPVGGLDEYYSLKDPSIVFYQGQWHLFCTVRGANRSHQIEYLRLSDLAHPANVERQFMAIHSGFYCAPQVFFFRPQQKWYLICQASDPSWNPTYGPAFATTTDISDVASWSRLAPLQHQKSTANAELDFWIICDSEKAHLFFTSLDGQMWREETKLSDFPHGWSTPVVALKGDVFEASHTYKVRGSEFYLTLIEAQHKLGGRYYKAYVADRLDGTWQPIAASEANSFADSNHVRFKGTQWSDSISHGELLRAEYDERVEVQPNTLRFIFQGVLKTESQGKVYGQLPWKLGILSRAEDPEP